MASDPWLILERGLVGRYVLERELGRGGMATVYLARDMKHERPVALKVLRAELAVSLGPERFRREITRRPIAASAHLLGLRLGRLRWAALVHHAVRSRGDVTRAATPRALPPAR